MVSPAGRTSAPSQVRIWHMYRTSLSRGTRRMTHGSLVSSVAARIGSTAFFAPLTVTSPCKGTPPFINKLSMSISAADQNSLALSVIPGDGFDNPLLLQQDF